MAHRTVPSGITGPYSDLSQLCHTFITMIVIPKAYPTYIGYGGKPVAENDLNRTTYLALDQLAANPRLAKRLPPDLARRCHALPLAEDKGRVTVAMADPADAKARDAVVTALGSASCLVQGDATTIDTLLSQIWASEVERPPRFLLCGFPDSISEQVQDYAQAMGELLGAGIDCLSTPGPMRALSGGCVDHDLVVFEGPQHPLVHRLLSRPLESGSALWPSPHSLGILVAQQPRWPLKHILLVVQGEEGDDAALDWVLRLSKAAGSAVTVLVVVPLVPAMYGQRGQIGQGLRSLLSADSPLGRQVRRISHRLVDWEITGTLRLRQGLPDRQIGREMAEGDHDLVALAATPCSWWRRCLEGDLVGPVLRLAGRPVLVARPVIS
jgi:hypothetical protein